MRTVYKVGWSTSEKKGEIPIYFRWRQVADLLASIIETFGAISWSIIVNQYTASELEKMK